VCVQEANLGKVAESFDRSDQGKYFFKINQNYFAHICPEYCFRVKGTSHAEMKYLSFFLLRFMLFQTCTSKGEFLRDLYKALLFSSKYIVMQKSHFYADFFVLAPFTMTYRYRPRA